MELFFYGPNSGGDSVTTDREDAFESTRALLRECLTFPGQSYRTIAEAIGSHASSIRSWVTGDPPKTPKTATERERIASRVWALLAALRSATSDPANCDPEWRSSIAAYMMGRGWTPEQLAESVGAPVHQAQRWITSGELPNDRVRKALHERTGFDFDASTIRRAVAIARAAHDGAFPPSLDGIQDIPTLRAAIADLRGRAGKTTDELATTVGSDASRMRNLSGARPGNLRYGAEVIAAEIGRLARFATTMPADAGDPIAAALVLLRSRPGAPPSAASGFTISWDRIEAKLQTGHRNLRYRRPGGETIAVLLVRFAIAFEQSGVTTAVASARTGISTDLFDSWLHGRTIPGSAQLDTLASAIRTLNGEEPAESDRRSDDDAPPNTPRDLPRDPLASGPVAPAAAGPTVVPPVDEVVHEDGDAGALSIALPIPGILDVGIESAVLMIDGMLLALTVVLRELNDRFQRGAITPAARSRYQRLLAGPLYVLFQQETRLMVPEPEGLPDALRRVFEFWEFPDPEAAQASRDHWRTFLGPHRRTRGHDHKRKGGKQ